VPLVLDLHITHERFGSSSDPSINGHLHYPNDLDRPLNEAVADKIRAYRADYNNRPSNAISFMSAIASTWDSSTSGGRCSPHNSSLRSATFLPRLQHYGLSRISTAHLGIASKSHTHPSHSQTSRLSASSLSLGVPVPRATQWMRGVKIPQL
jgi:hypothetical protein